jgi:antibiotic biosynthesis monooxygenase (ABM) superfamily enzyme
MYGTVARFRIKPGMEQRLLQLNESYKGLDVPGYRGETVYRLDSGSNEYIMAVVFDNKETYMANAQSPDQHQRYLDFRELLDSDPEWMDGEIVDLSVRP